MTDIKQAMTKLKMSAEDYIKINEILCECVDNANRAIVEFGSALIKINKIAKGEKEEDEEDEEEVERAWERYTELMNEGKVPIQHRSAIILNEKEKKDEK